jgi:hypothetical protein
MVAISRSKVKLWIVAASAQPSTLLANTTFNGSNLGYIAGQIRSYSKTGGEDQVDSQAVFGGFVDIEKPRSQFEMSFEIVPDVDTNPDIWDAFIYGTNASGVYATNADAANKAIYIQATNSTNNKSWGMNNCNAVSFEFQHNADENQTGTLKFKFSPTDPNGIPNFMTKALAVTALPNWTTLTA